MNMDSSTMRSDTNERKTCTLNSVLESLYDVDHYVEKSGEPILKHFDNKTYRVVVYQDCHADEYTVYELVEGSNGLDRNDRNGLAQHFKKGVIQLSWQMERGKRSGALTIYVNGVVERMTSWSSLRNLDNKRRGLKSKGNMSMSVCDDDHTFGEVYNERGLGRILIERDLLTDQIIYRGGYNEFTLRREGYGICYDNTSGVEMSFGYYVDGKLDHLIQEFVLETDLNGNENGKKSGKEDDRKVNEDEKSRNSTLENGDVDNKNKNGNRNTKLMMIEYGGNVLENNIDLPFNRKPIYIGDYMVNRDLEIENDSDETINETNLKSPFIRHGHGYVMNELSGICDHESDWCNGVETNDSISKLYCGWYDNMSTGSRGGRHRNNGHIVKDAKDTTNGKDGNVTENDIISINVSMIDEEARKRREEEERKRREEEEQRIFLLTSKLSLRGDLTLINYHNVEILKIGDGQPSGGISSDVSVKLDEMPNLEELSIGNNNFQQVRGFILNNLPSLKKVQIGNDCFRITRQWKAWKDERQDGIFSITNCPKLTSLQIGDNSFVDFKTFSISSIGLLDSIEFGKENFLFADCILQGILLIYSNYCRSSISRDNYI